MYRTLYIELPLYSSVHWNLMHMNILLWWLIPWLLSFGQVDLKSALGKQRRDGKSASPQPLTAMQRLHIGRLIEKYGDDYEVQWILNIKVCEFCTFHDPLFIYLFVVQRMFMDTKLNSMQHSVATLEKLCKRYHMHKDRNPIIVPSWQ